MKKLVTGLILMAILLSASCEAFFSGNTGEDGIVTLVLRDSAAGTFRSLFDPPKDPNGEVIWPDLENARIRVSAVAGNVVREYTVAGDGEWKFSVPAGGPYGVDFSASVIHDPDAEADLFPFVKSFGAEVRVERVRAGSTQTIRLPLRVRETAIMAPYRPEGQGANTGVFAPFYDLPAEYPGNAGYVSRNFDTDPDYYFEIDPYGRLITTIGGVSHIQMAENLGDLNSLVNPVLVHFYGFAYQLPEGDLYFTYTYGSGNTYHFSRESNNLLGDISSTFGPALSSPLITIDEDGTLYGIQNNNSISVWDMAGGYEGEPSYSLDTNRISGKVAPEGTVELFSDIKALNGRLYALLHIKEGEANYHALAAIPLESVKNGNVEGMWFMGEKVPDFGAVRESREGFFHPKKIVGWGPDRLYVFDETQLPEGQDNYYRIVEVDIGNRQISGVGLFVKK
jgi:hypothetical protein